MVYTAATFAQTKFGSTKLKTNSKKPARMSPTEFSNYIKQRAIQKQQQQSCHTGYSTGVQGWPGQDKQYYSGNCYSGNSNNPNMNYNNFPKSPGSSMPMSNNDYGYGFGGSSLNSSAGGNSSYNNQQQSDYSSLLSEFSSTDFDLDTNAFLQDILTSAGVGGGQNPKSLSSSRQNSGSGSVSGYDDWLGGSGASLGFTTESSMGLGPESRSSSTKSMSSGSDSLPSPPTHSAQPSTEGFINPRVLVAN